VAPPLGLAAEVWVAEGVAGWVGVVVGTGVGIGVGTEVGFGVGFGVGGGVGAGVGPVTVTEDGATAVSVVVFCPLPIPLLAENE
jgi:hypothetical protein